MSGTLAAIFGLPGSKKWIAREGRAGISRNGSGAPTASGSKKSLALRMGRTLAAAGSAGYDASHGLRGIDSLATRARRVRAAERYAPQLVRGSANGPT